MWTQLINTLDELGFTDVEPYLSEYLTTASKDGIGLQEALLEITNREISLRNKRAAKYRLVYLTSHILKALMSMIFIFRTQ